MKASELIKQLNEVISQHGDVEIVSHKFYNAGYYGKVVVEILPQDTARHYKWDLSKKYCLVGSDD